MPSASASKPSPPASPAFQAQWLNVHVDFPLLQRLALPITIGAVRYPGIKIHDPRVIRLLEVLLHGGSHVGLDRQLEGLASQPVVMVAQPDEPSSATVHSASFGNVGTE